MTPDPRVDTDDKTAGQPGTQDKYALSGVTVLDLSRVLAGPWSAQILGDLGAEVIKVEAPVKGDDTRLWGPPFLERHRDSTPDEPRESAYYLCGNRNKRSIAIDMATPEGAALIRELARKADVIVENYKVGGLTKYGLDYESIHKINPHAVYCSITGFGQYGPYADRGGYDFVAQAMGGLMSVTGQPRNTPGGGPVKVGVAVCDLFTGMYAAVSILAALRHAERTGEGQHIDLCLLDTQMAMLANQGASYLISGTVGQPLGNAHPTVVPYRLFETADGEMVIAIGNDGQFANLCEVIGHPEIAADERYAKNHQRVVNRASLEATLAEIVSRMTTGDLIEKLATRGVPCGPLNTIDKAFADPHIKARQMVHVFSRDDGVDVPVTAFPAKLSATPARYAIEPPRLGQHTDEILKEHLLLSDDNVARLRAQRIIG